MPSAGADGMPALPSYVLRPAYRRVAWIACAYVLATAALLPFATVAGPVIPGITPAFVAAVVTTDLATAFLLFVRLRDGRTWSLLLLGCAYLFGGTMGVLHLLTFPGALLADRTVVGTSQSTGWVFLLWVNGYATLTLAAVAAEAIAPRRRIAAAVLRRVLVIAIAATAAAVLACALVAIGLAAHLPAPVRGAAWTPLDTAVSCAALALMATAAALIFGRIGRRNPLFLWLGLALVAMIAANLLSLASGGRYTLGWSMGRLSWMVSAGMVFLFFMGQFAIHQRLLARARDTLERRVADRTAVLTRTVAQRDRLVQEVYHRVTNNLQVVDSLIALARRDLTGPAGGEAFNRLRDRIFTLGLVHQQLMTSDDLETFAFAPFLQELVPHLARGIPVSIETDPVMVNLDFAIPAGLLAAELLLEALRAPYAAHIAVTFRCERDGSRVLAVRHDGDGTSGGLVVEDRLVAGLARQLGGVLRIVREGGMQVEVRAPAAQMP